MKNLIFVFCAIATIALCLTATAFGQVLKVEPAKPKWGDTLKITYDPSVSGAMFTLEQEIAVLLGQRKPDDPFMAAITFQNVPMMKTGKVLTCEVMVENDVSSISLVPVKRDKSDLNASQSWMVYRPDGQPTKGAYLSMARIRGNNGYQEWIDKELSLYPDNYNAYLAKWLAVRSLDRPNLKTTIEADIKQVSAQVKGEPLDWLEALVIGNLWLGQEEPGRRALLTMLEKYPDAPKTRGAYGRYRYESEAQGFTGTGPQEINQKVLGLMKRNPASMLARNAARSLVSDKSQPVELLEMVLRRWIADQPQNPDPYIDLASALSERDQKPEEVLLLSDKALDLLLHGKAQEKSRLSGDFFEQLVLPGIYYLNAKAAFKLGKYAQALSALKAAQSLNKQTPADYSLLEGSIWEKAGMLTKAEQVYLTAWQRGSKEAEAKLKSLYLQDGGAESGFDNWLSKRSAEARAVTPATTAQKNLTNFSVATLTGKKYDLATLRGKVVVLNFWFISCGPCRAEMPELNKLVKEYENRGVVFLAATFDDAESVKAFQKEKEFNYEIIPGAQSWIDELGVHAYPTHYVLNGQGEIELMLLGGNDKNIEQIRNLLDRLVPAN